MLLCLSSGTDLQKSRHVLKSLSLCNEVLSSLLFSSLLSLSLSLSLRYFLSFRYSPALSEDRLVIEKSLTRMNRCVCVCVWGGDDEGRGGGGGWLYSRQMNDQCLVCYHLPRLYRVGRISLFFLKSKTLDRSSSPKTTRLGPRQRAFLRPSPGDKGVSARHAWLDQRINYTVIGKPE